MEIKMLVSRAGAGFCDNPGDVIEVGENEGQRMIEAGQAELHVSATQKQSFTSKNKSKGKK